MLIRRCPPEGEVEPSPYLAESPRPIAFFDRDDTLNRDEKGYTHRHDELVWHEGAMQSIKRCNDLGLWVVVVTNQGAIGAGHYEERHVHEFARAMNRDLASLGARIDATYYAPFSRKATDPRYLKGDEFKKPAPGMLLQAMRDLPAQPERSFLIGDRDTDVAAAVAAGIRGFMYHGGDLSEFLDYVLRRRGIV